MSFLASLGYKDSPALPNFNTGTLTDYLVGKFIPGVGGCTIMDGGIATTNAVVGPPQAFKSTTNNGLIVNVVARYPDAEALIYDTEGSLKDKSRILEMSSLYRDDPIKRKKHLEDLGRRIIIVNRGHYPMLDDFDEEVKKIYAARKKDLNKYIIETPILDPITGKPMRIVKPIFIVIDSLSKAKVRVAEEMLEKHGASSSETNTMAMREALAKNRIIGKYPNYAETSGIYFSMTAQLTSKIEMNSYLPPSKDIQFMRQGEKLKGVGNDFLYLVSTHLEVRSPKVLLDSNKECEYPLPSGITAPTEMNEVTMGVVRCKNHGAGLQFKPVLSQTHGYEPDLTNYHYLRTMNYFGLGTNKIHPRPCLAPDATFTRKTAYAKLLDYKTARAVEILAQHCLVQSSWTIHDMCVPFDLTPEQLADELGKTTYGMSEILESRGWWTYGAHERSYLSLFDILAIIKGSYKPKLLPVK